MIGKKISAKPVGVLWNKSVTLTQQAIGLECNMKHDDITKYRRSLADHFKLRYMLDINTNTGKMYGYPYWAADLYNDLAAMHKEQAAGE
jgi:hypothetical protein